MHRRNPTRNRKAPKRFEDEKFVSGAIDRYQHSYDGTCKEGTAKAGFEDREYYYGNGKVYTYCKYYFHHRIHGKTSFSMYMPIIKDYPESLLEFSSIWRDMKMILPSEIVSFIGSFLNMKKIDKKLIKDDDEFIAADDSDSDNEDNKNIKKWSCSGLPVEDEEELWSSEDETDDDIEWDSDCLSEDD